MKLLLDQNLSPRLLGLLADLFPESRHVREVGLASADDTVIWAYAAVASPLRRRVAVRGRAKQAVTVRLGPAQVTVLKRLARRRRIPSEDLLRTWIAAALAKERSG